MELNERLMAAMPVVALVLVLALYAYEAVYHSDAVMALVAEVRQ